MFKINLLNKISPVGTDNFNKNLYEIGEGMANPDAVLVRSAAMHDMTLPPSLKAIARAGAGTNNIPVDRCTEAGIVVFNTPGANANAVKELGITALLLASRDIIGGVNWAKGLSGTAADVTKEVENGKAAFVGPELRGKTLGVVGLGAIGAILANTALHLGMEVYGNDPYITVDNAWMLSRSVKKADERKIIFEKSDYITLHAPVTPETKYMVNAESIAQMKDGVRIINMSRADLVNDADMAAALESGKVARYVTDFPNEAVISMKNCIAIPHLGASTPESEDNCAVMAANQLIDFLENGNIKNSVNFPTLYEPRASETRLCVMHKNIPNMLSQISSAVAAQGLNIEHMTNRSKKDAAYTMLEISGDLPRTVADSLKAIDGIIRVNVIR